LRKDFHHPLSSFAGDTEVMESDRTQIGADKHRCAQDLEESRNSRNQVNLLSHIHGSLLGLLLRQQAAPFVGILSKNPNEHQREYRLQDRAGFASGSELRSDFKQKIQTGSTSQRLASRIDKIEISSVFPEERQKGLEINRERIS
jgi:hypothetical protein